jgi:hypothetical protein
MNMKHILLIIYSTTIFSGCETIVDFPESPNSKTIPVIEAILTDQLTNHYVRVSYSASLTDTSASIPLNDATIRVIAGLNDTINYTCISKGWYKSEPYKATPNVNYTLEVCIDTIVYKSTGKIIEMNGIDSLYFRYANNSSYYVYMDAGITDPDVVHYYLINAKRNDTLITKGSEIWMINDKYTYSLNKIPIPYIFKESDTVSIELHSISKEMFDYYYFLGIEIFAVNFMNMGYANNPKSMFEPDALGYFQLSAVSRKGLRIKNNF